MNRYHSQLEHFRQSPRTWLVTGAAGFIGSHLLETLLKLDQTVIALDNFSTGKRHNLAQVMKSVGPARRQRMRFIEGDIRDPAVCRNACRDVDLILHQAAIGSVPRSMAEPLENHATNVTGFVNMLVAARDQGVSRVVYAASSSTYGDGRRIPMIESEIGRPLSPYALTKYIDELYADLFARCFGLDTIGLRYFNVFGPRQDPEGDYAAVIPKWTAALLDGDPVFINGDGSTARDFCYVDNVVQANLLAAGSDNPEAVNQVYNVACGEETTLDQLFVLLRDLLAEQETAIGERAPIYREFRPGDMRISRADIGKARRLLGYEPLWEIRDGLNRTLDWYVATLRHPLPGLESEFRPSGAVPGATAWAGALS